MKTENLIALEKELAELEEKISTLSIEEAKKIPGKKERRKYLDQYCYCKRHIVRINTEIEMAIGNPLANIDD